MLYDKELTGQKQVASDDESSLALNPWAVIQSSWQRLPVVPPNRYHHKKYFNKEEQNSILSSFIFQRD